MSGPNKCKITLVLDMQNYDTSKISLSKIKKEPKIRDFIIFA